LALFAAGKTTGLVVDCGAGVCSSVPIYEGYAIPHAIRKNEFAGNDIDHHLIDQSKNILKNNIKLNFSSDR
jgi:actin-related protein